MTLSGRDARTAGDGLSALAGRDLIRLARGSTLHGETEYLFLARPGPRRRLCAVAARGPGRGSTRRPHGGSRSRPESGRMRSSRSWSTTSRSRSTSLGRSATPPWPRGWSPRPSPRSRAPGSGPCASTSPPLNVISREPWSSSPRTRASDAELLPRWGEALLLRNRFQEAANAFREAMPGLKATGQIPRRGDGHVLARQRAALPRQSRPLP